MFSTCSLCLVSQQRQHVRKKGCYKWLFAQVLPVYLSEHLENRGCIKNTQRRMEKEMQKMNLQEPIWTSNTTKVRTRVN